MKKIEETTRLTKGQIRLIGAIYGDRLALSKGVSILETIPSEAVRFQLVGMYNKFVDEHPYNTLDEALRWYRV